MTTTSPAFNYTSRDFASVMADLQARIPSVLPEWTNREPSDFGMVLLNLFAYTVDITSYYLDRVANEAFLSTATQRKSVLGLAQMLDYTPSGPQSSSVTVQFGISSDAPGNVTIPTGTQVSTVGSSTLDPVVFETTAPVTIAPGATGTAAAIQGKTITDEAVGTSIGEVDQDFTLFQTPVAQDSLTVYVDEGAGPVLWLPLSHLIDASNNQRAYTTYTDESSVVHVVFGDGANGKIPALGASITATYRVGGGAAGNVGADTVVQSVSALANVATITNPAVASGGADAETLDQIRVNAPRSLRTVNRGVTLADYAGLAKQVAGVQHAAAVGTASTAVTVYVSPTGGGAPSTTLKNAVLAYIADRKMFSTSVSAADPTYVNVNITVQDHVLPTYRQSVVDEAVKDALNNLLSLDNNDFGARISLSAVYRAVNAVEGLDYAVVTVLDVGVGTGLADVVLGSHELPAQPGTISTMPTGGLS